MGCFWNMVGKFSVPLHIKEKSKKKLPFPKSERQIVIILPNDIYLL